MFLVMRLLLTVTHIYERRQTQLLQVKTSKYKSSYKNTYGHCNFLYVIITRAGMNHFCTRRVLIVIDA